VPIAAIFSGTAHPWPPWMATGLLASASQKDDPDDYQNGLKLHRWPLSSGILPPAGDYRLARYLFGPVAGPDAVAGAEAGAGAVPLAAGGVAAGAAGGGANHTVIPLISPASSLAVTRSDFNV
jgi:hypothetical protein